VRITIQAKDLNTNFNQIIIPKNIARDILNEMKLPMFGKMHPEKFHKKLVQFIDLSQNDTALVENIFEALTELEDLCTECISYESFLEWKVS
jgi:glutaredoxin 2